MMVLYNVCVNNANGVTIFRCLYVLMYVIYVHLSKCVCEKNSDSFTNLTYNVIMHLGKSDKAHTFIGYIQRR